jgi:hypothetical protein
MKLKLYIFFKLAAKVYIGKNLTHLKISRTGPDLYNLSHITDVTKEKTLIRKMCAGANNKMIGLFSPALTIGGICYQMMSK